MAGAGYKQFAVGEVLTASDTNTYLMDQSVMVFADSAARGSALGTAVAEGMLSYLSDTDAVEVYDGSSWSAVAADVSSLDASVITSGTFDVARIPDLAASKITSGVFDAARIPDVANAGIGSNAVQASTASQFITTSTSFVNVPGLAVTITPTSSSSKILVIAQISHGVGRSGDGFEIRVTGGNAANYGSGTGGPVFGGSSSNDGDGDRRHLYSGSVVYLDSPATTSATTYRVQIRKSAGSDASVNRAVEVTFRKGASSISAIEVKP